MTRLVFLLASLKGSRSLNRLALFYVAGMLFLFCCLIGGLPRMPSAPAHPGAKNISAMPKPQPVPANAAEELRKRIDRGPRIAN